ncbi:hypothetical protein GCM10010260_10230 [Streptomyces filipinensis]|uniref:Secreted protein n=1 Tax=Streptomyces filipinensis TaxID=66887 RepID=A0A918I6X1_9ACTN|nr:hypothetical protein GCM10010260_10230 [Streptomyces filipinensis]
MRVTRNRLLGVALAAVTSVGIASSPAFAGVNTPHSYGYGACSRTSEGWFVADGDSFYLRDTCADNFSAALEVDVAPLKGDEGYDFIVWNNGGRGTIQFENSHNFPEGRKICVKAGIGHPQPGGEMGGYGRWECGET